MTSPKRLRSDLALNIRNLRKQRGLSQADLAARMGLPAQAVQRIERPGYGRMSLSTLTKLAIALKVDLIVRLEEPA